MRFPVVPVFVLCSLVSAVTTAQTEPPQQPKDFATAKAQNVARLQTELACVQAATTFEAMRACRPQPPGGRMMMGSPPDQK
jgi:hypothetical protein